MSKTTELAPYHDCPVCPACDGACGMCDEEAGGTWLRCAMCGHEWHGTDAEYQQAMWADFAWEVHEYPREATR
jgi:hypothetical protein